MIEELENLAETGVLSEGQSNPSINFITQALRDIEKGKTGKAVQKLEAAIERLQGLIEDGSLDANQGDALIEMLLAIIDNIE